MNTTTYTHANGVTVTTVDSPATYVGRGEFYTGLKTGDAVTLHTTTYSGGPLEAPSVHWSVSNGGASLAIYDRTLVQS